MYPENTNNLFSFNLKVAIFFSVYVFVSGDLRSHCLSWLNFLRRLHVRSSSGQTQFNLNLNRRLCLSLGLNLSPSFSFSLGYVSPSVSWAVSQLVAWQFIHSFCLSCRLDRRRCHCFSVAVAVAVGAASLRPQLTSRC